MTINGSDPRAQILAGSPEWQLTWSLKDIPKQLREQMPDDYWEQIIEGGTDRPYRDSELMRESYWQRVDEQERIDATPLGNVTRAEFERMIEGILWRVLQRAEKAVSRFALLAVVIILIYTLISRIFK